MAQFRGFNKVALCHQLQPIGNIVVHWALPLTIGIAAGQAAMGLAGRLLLGKRIIDFNKLTDPTLHIALWWIDSLNVEKLKLIVRYCHNLFSITVRVTADWRGPEPKGCSGSLLLA
jgi:hypothetical protein